MERKRKKERELGSRGGMRVLILSHVKRVISMLLITIQVQRPHGVCAGLKAPNRCSIDRVFFHASWGSTTLLPVVPRNDRLLQQGW
jgi:hypothetical protein